MGDSRISSWHPHKWISWISWTSNQDDADQSESTLDLENNSFGIIESLRRRNALKSKINQKRKKSYYMDSKGVTIFDLYHPWKIEKIEKSIYSLPTNVQPLFQASMDGNLELLQHYLALALLKKEGDFSLSNLKDEKGRSPLHFASSFGHLDVVSLLINEGMNPNMVEETESITPLMCAAVNGNEKIIDLLLDKGAEINYGLESFDARPRELVRCQAHADSDLESLTALSWAVKAGNIHSVKYLLDKGALLTGTTINCETPIHISSYLGYSDILKLLVQHGKNSLCLELRGGRDTNTALHISVEQCHLACTEVLLNMGAQPNNENALGQVPLHLAALANDYDSMLLLLKFNADVNLRDNRGRSAIHYCIRYATSSNYIEAMECLDLLLSHGADINAQDENGFTPFHAAAVDNGASIIVATLLKQGADLTLVNNSGQSGIEMLVKKMPHAIRYIRESLDFAISVTDKDTADPECVISFDFRPIIVLNNNETNTKIFRKETELLTSFCEFGHNDILSHPIIEAFLILKWERVKKYFWASFVANMMLVLMYSFFVVQVYAIECPLNNIPFNNLTLMANGNLATKWMPLYLKVSWYLLLFMITIFMIKELLQMLSYTKAYFHVVENYAQLLFIALAIITIFPYPVGPITFEGNLCSCLRGFLYQHYWFYRFASVGVVSAWVLILIRIAKLPKLGLYVQMLFKVVGNFGKFIIAYSSIIIAFALSFGILLDQVYHTIFNSFLATIVMMTGEIDLNDIIQYTGDKKPLPVVTYIMFTTFVLLVTVVLMNLLIAIAVSDIQGLMEGAKVARLSRLVFAISQLESMLFSKGLISLLPKQFVYRLRKNALFAEKDNRITIKFRPHDPRNDVLPKCVQFDALRILEKRENEKICSIKKANQVAGHKVTLLEKIEKLEDAIRKIYEIVSKPDHPGIFSK